jgi:hypothetical protein
MAANPLKTTSGQSKQCGPIAILKTVWQPNAWTAELKTATYFNYRIPLMDPAPIGKRKIGYSDAY